jgi:hypothetical protein
VSDESMAIRWEHSMDAKLPVDIHRCFTRPLSLVSPASDIRFT